MPGAAGEPGAAGATGATGATGIAGVAGPTGATGPLPVIATDGGLVGDGSAANPLAVDPKFAGSSGAVTTAGLILHLDAANSASYPGTGVFWKDISGSGSSMGDADMSVGNFVYNAQTKTMVNTTDAANGGISIGLSNFNKLEGTMEFWVNARTYTGSNGLFVNNSSSTQNPAGWLWFGPYDNGQSLYLRFSESGDCCSKDIWLPASPPPGQWVQMFATWSNSGKELQVGWNGSVLAKRAVTTLTASNPATTGRIGIGHVNTTAQFLGQIGIVRFYNRALTPAELRSNFNANRSRYGL